MNGHYILYIHDIYIIIGDITHYMHTSYETFLMQSFQDMGHFLISRGIKTPFLISTINVI